MQITTRRHMDTEVSQLGFRDLTTNPFWILSMGMACTVSIAVREVLVAVRLPN